MKEQGRLFLGAGDRNSKLILMGLAQNPTTGECGVDRLFNPGFIQRLGLDPVKVLGRFILGQQLDRPDAIPADGGEQFEGLGRIRGKPRLEPGADASAVRQKIIKKIGNRFSTVGSVTRSERQGK